jgi:hypothetical protein
MFNLRNEIKTCSTKRDNRTAATLCTLETWFVSDTLHKGDNNFNNNNNNVTFIDTEILLTHNLKTKLQKNKANIRKWLLKSSDSGN